MSGLADSFSLYDLLSDFITATLEVHLYTNVQSLDVVPTIGGFTEATYIGYKPQTVVFHNPPFLDPVNGIASNKSANLFWIVQGPDGPANDINGYYVTAKMSDGTFALVQFDNFQNPQHMADLGNTFAFNIEFDVDLFTVPV